MLAEMSKTAAFPRPFLTAAALSLLCAVSMAADIPSSNPPRGAAKAYELDVARARIASRDWVGALAELRRVDARHSADWNNLMGYTLRKSPQPDWDAASRYYDEALRIDPEHRGALAYSGELALQRDDLTAAQHRLDALERVCGRQSCQELVTLRDAMTLHKARHE